MAVLIRLDVQPGRPDVPQTVVISGSGLDNTKSVQLLVDGAVEATFMVVPTGLVVGAFPVPARLRDALFDIGGFGAEIKTGVRRVLAGIGVGTGSSALRYDS